MTNQQFTLFIGKNTVGMGAYQVLMLIIKGQQKAGVVSCPGEGGRFHLYDDIDRLQEWFEKEDIEPKDDVPSSLLRPLRTILRAAIDEDDDVCEEPARTIYDHYKEES